MQTVKGEEEGIRSAKDTLRLLGGAEELARRLCGVELSDFWHCFEIARKRQMFTELKSRAVKRDADKVSTESSLLSSSVP